MTVERRKDPSAFERHFTTLAVSIALLILGALGKIAYQMNNSLQVIPVEIGSMRKELTDLKEALQRVSDGYMPRTEAQIAIDHLNQQQHNLETRVQRLEDKRK